MVSSGVVVGNVTSARTSSGPVPTAHTHLVPPASMPPYGKVTRGAYGGARGSRERLGDAMWRQLDASVSRRLMGAMARPPGLAHVESPEVRDVVAKVEGSITGVFPGEAGWWLGPVVLLWVQGIVSLVIVASYRWWLA